jgi:hypothetical protein
MKTQLKLTFLTLLLGLAMGGLAPSAHAESFLLGAGVEPVFRAGVLGSFALQARMPYNPYLNQIYRRQNEEWEKCFRKDRRRAGILREEEIAERQGLVQEELNPLPPLPLPPIFPAPVFPAPIVAPVPPPVAAFGVPAPGFGEQVIDLRALPPLPH